MTVLMIPIDVANNGGALGCTLSGFTGAYCGGINFKEVWQSLFLLGAFFICTLIPFAIFYYETDDGSLFRKADEPARCFRFPRRFCSGFTAATICTCMALVLVVTLYYQKGDINIPVYTKAYELSNLQTETYTYKSGNNPYTLGILSLTDIEKATYENAIKTTSHISFSVYFPIYVIALVGWGGFWMFSLFAGAGMSALPVGLIAAFIYRPQLMGPDQVAQKEIELQERTKELLEISILLKRERQAFSMSSAGFGERQARAMTDRVEVNRLAQMVFVLERDVEEFRDCKKVGDDWAPLIPWVKLLLGIASALGTSVWLTHIMIFMILSPPQHSFLNAYLKSFDSWFPIFGNLTYAFLSLYLLLCTIVGCFKIGLRFLCISIHPMKQNGTYVNSFLFNLGIMLICTIPVVHFCTYAFAGYTKNTDSFQIFVVQIENLEFFGYFQKLKVFTYIIFVSACVSFLYLIRRPREVPSSAEDFKQKLARRGAFNDDSDSIIPGVDKK
jgi:LMBR1 domain-containing protein 1